MGDNSDRLDRELKVLASRERREILDHFIATDADVTSVEILCCKVARVNAGEGTAEAASTETAKAELHHVHLPKLAEHELVEYDARSGTVRYRPDERVEALVQFLAER